MKTLRIIGLFLALLVAVNASAQKSNKQKDVAEIKIKTSAQCGDCKDRIEKTLSYEKGVVKSTLDLTTKEVTVKYKPSKISVDKIKLAITKVGYDADDKLADANAYASLPACCKKP